MRVSLKTLGRVNNAFRLAGVLAFTLQNAAAQLNTPLMRVPFAQHFDIFALPLVAYLHFLPWMVSCWPKEQAQETRYFQSFLEDSTGENRTTKCADQPRPTTKCADQSSSVTQWLNQSFLRVIQLAQIATVALTSFLAVKALFAVLGISAFAATISLWALLALPLIAFFASKPVDILNLAKQVLPQFSKLNCVCVCKTIAFSLLGNLAFLIVMYFVLISALHMMPIVCGLSQTAQVAVSATLLGLTGIFNLLKLLDQHSQLENSQLEKRKRLKIQKSSFTEQSALTVNGGLCAAHCGLVSVGTLSVCLSLLTQAGVNVAINAQHFPLLLTLAIFAVGTALINNRFFYVTAHDTVRLLFKISSGNATASYQASQIRV